VHLPGPKLQWPAQPTPPPASPSVSSSPWPCASPPAAARQRDEQLDEGIRPTPSVHSPWSPPPFAHSSPFCFPLPRSSSSARAHPSGHVAVCHRRRGHGPSRRPGLCQEHRRPRPHRLQAPARARSRYIARIDLFFLLCSDELRRGFRPPRASRAHCLDPTFPR
jgi:hypothetical protein